ncbi:MAG: response regulator [Polyangiaceae bacterium]|nr:response regulator [Polyangiaceae bacterium]
MTGSTDQASSPPSSGPEAAGGVVLVVDDEPAVRRVLARSLRELGHRSVPVESGEHAIAWLDAGEGPPVLAIVDMMMPGMNGTETVTALRARLPSLPVIACTAYALSATTVLELPDTELLEKPFDLAQLAACLGKLLPA